MSPPHDDPDAGLQVDERLVDSGRGWRVSLRRLRRRGPLAEGTRPVVLVPGFATNGFALAYHPTGPSLAHVLAQAGLETWTADLRGQGKALRAGGARRYGIAELALEDLPAAVAGVLDATATGASEVDLVGVGLGVALVFAWLATNGAAPVRAVGALGGLVTWTEVPPLVALASVSPVLAGRLRLRRTRTVARFALPALARLAPGALGGLVNPGTSDLREARLLAQVLEDPAPGVAHDLARWVLDRELTVRGTNVSRRLGELTHPLFVAVARDDGLVPAAASRSLHAATSATSRTLVELGGEATDGTPRRVARGDLLFGHGMDVALYTPLARFLARTPARRDVQRAASSS